MGGFRVQGQVTYLSTDKRTPLQIQNSCDLSCIWTTYTLYQHRFFLASQSIISNILQLQLLRKQLSPTNHYTPVKHGHQMPDIHSLFQIITEQHFSRWSEGPPLLCSVWGFRSDGCQWHRTLAVTYIPCIWQGYVGPNHFLFVRSPQSAVITFGFVSMVTLPLWHRARPEFYKTHFSWLWYSNNLIHRPKNVRNPLRKKKPKKHWSHFSFVLLTLDETISLT